MLSLTALTVVLWGYTQPPIPDEGTGAHIFQLSVMMLVPVLLVHVATADWTPPLRSACPLALAAVAITLAFAALYYLEHVYYPGGQATGAPNSASAQATTTSRIIDRSTYSEVPAIA